nr:gamma-interferon-inducible lysosomal thiol reductase-like [Quercus suber]
MLIPISSTGKASEGCIRDLGFHHKGPSESIYDYLVIVFMEDLINIVNLRLVPWENALIVEPNKNIICQHGPDEYNLNAIEACAINIWPDVKQHFKFIKCVENQDSEGRQIGENTWKSCCQQLSLSPRPVSDCYNSGLGRELLLHHADETNHLNPPHTFVPWLILDNQPLYKDFKNLVTYVCKAYKGHLQIKACKSLPEEINLDENANSIQPLSNASEAKKMHGSQIAS